MNMRALTVAILCALVPTLLKAQRLENLVATFRDGKVILVYNLSGGKDGQLYKIAVYGSHNNFATPLKLVRGDVGESVGVGTGKSIEWNAADELGSFSGEIAFRLRGEPVIMPIKFMNPQNGASFKRGKGAAITWNGGNPTQSIRLEVVKDGKVVQSVTQSTANNGSFTWNIPSKFSKGDYTMRLTSGAEVVQSSSFKVKAKVPLILKATPLIIIGVVLAVMPKKSPGDTTTTTSEDLPDASLPK